MFNINSNFRLDSYLSILHVANNVVCSNPVKLFSWIIFDFDAECYANVNAKIAKLYDCYVFTVNMTGIESLHVL